MYRSLIFRFWSIYRTLINTGNRRINKKCLRTYQQKMPRFKVFFKNLPEQSEGQYPVQWNERRKRNAMEFES
jgi:hypothetical protein